MNIVEYHYIDNRSDNKRTLLIEKDLCEKLDAFLVSLSLLHDKEAIIEYLGEVAGKEMIVITLFLNNDRKHITCMYKDYIHEETPVNFGSLNNHSLERKTFIDSINCLNQV